MAIFVGVGIANAAVRDENSRTRQPQKNITTRTQNVDNVSRTTKQNVVSRNAVTARTASRATTTERTRHAGTISRAASTVAARTSSPTTTARAGTTANASRPARATVISTATPSATFDTGYNICRDAYFTCMDQFCANANDTYRRCVCSSKLTEIQSRENALTQAGYQIQDFKDLNISVINKTANEVNAMLSATTGEKA